MITALSILITIFGITAVVCLHELGHLYFAKRYGVYCYEYSIGLGPKIFSKRFGKSETKVSLRWLPLGGYVSMAGEGDDEEKQKVGEVELTEDDEPVVPNERSLNFKSKPKQVMVMFAGVMVNFILAFFLFFIKNLTTPVYNNNTQYFTVSENSNAYKAGLRTGDKFLCMTTTLVDPNDSSYSENFNTLPDEIKNTYFNTTITSYVELPPIPYTIRDEVNSKTYDLRPFSESCQLHRTFKIERVSLVGTTEKKEIKEITVVLNVDKNKATVEDGKTWYQFELFGFSGQKIHYDFGQAFTQSFIDFGMSIYSVFSALIGLFTPSGLKNVGGLISVFAVNQQAMSMGPGVVLQIWGLLSANLGVFNLIPFPGLDGWQICVATYEGVTKKKVSSKVKGIVNTVGMFILLGLGILLIGVDLFRLF